MTVKVKVPKIRIKEPERRFFTGLGLRTAKEIRERTESGGVDVNNKPFRPYDPKYRDFRAEKGRSTRPNLSFTGRMLGTVGRGVRATKKGFKIVLSGEEGFKAWVNETGRTRRDFFGMSSKQKDNVFNSVTKYFTTKNRLKKR